MMTPEERVEYEGLAATVGRLMMSLKQTEAALAQVRAELEATRSEKEETDERKA